MAKSRSELSALLHGICDHVYFQPPANTKLIFPCILYSLDKIDIRFADNDPYQLYDRYSITYITRDPDDENIHRLAMLRLCRFDRAYASDNLHHYSYTIYN